ncbi:MAG: sigma-70 family RNA polymerase sigma factor, partial [Muribaculaceae bacterium]|nr:sigma-70 family RNA polymerase sigma factor [Muribaculaceae bacterium]
MNSYLEIDNATLVDECKAGNQDALGMFYTRFAPKMYSVVMRYVSDPNDAKDILHDGFIVALTRLSSLRSAESVEYWLASIMKNLSLQFLQGQDVEKILHEIPEKEDTPEFEDIIDLTVLDSLIQKLPKGYQKVFRLAVLENKTHKEIAKILGIAPNSSSSQLFHAKMMMRKLIVEYRYKSGVLTLMLVALTAGFMWWHGTMDSEKQEGVSHIAFVGPSINSNEETS